VATIERTLVKSPPELWELVDNPELMGRWSAELAGLPGTLDVTVLEREPGERLVWKAAAGDASIELALAEKGWGTNVSIRITGRDAEDGPDSALEDDLLDELGSPQRKPFSRT
jgi:uncharacterized protein YndB with AHSA1/START domain